MVTAESAAPNFPSSRSTRAAPMDASESMFVLVVPAGSTLAAAKACWKRFIAVSNILAVVRGSPYVKEPSFCTWLNGTPEQ